MEAKVKHLEFIETIISRLAGNSFVLRGWSITVVAAILALSSAGSSTCPIYVAYFPIVAFWILDAFYLQQERMYRKLYNKVRMVDSSAIDFSLDAKPYSKCVDSQLRTMFCASLVWFHGSALITVILVQYWLS